MAKLITFSVSEEMKPIVDKFKEICQREGKSMSKMLVELIEDYVKRHANGNPAIPLDRWTEDKEFIACPTLGEPPWKYNLEDFSNEVLDMIIYHSMLWHQAANSERLKRQDKRRSPNI